MTNDAKQDRPEATERTEAPATDARQKEMRPPEPAEKDDTVVDPDTRLRDVLIGPAAGRRLE